VSPSPPTALHSTIAQSLPETAHTPPNTLHVHFPHDSDTGATQVAGFSVIAVSALLCIGIIISAIMYKVSGSGSQTGGGSQGAKQEEEEFEMRISQMTDRESVSEGEIL